ncbi:MAG: hypothetical protein Q8O67_27650 [Deltaproteobacteria bacterium]|nr:hypothetical protein [Deltaproteobacteria bacterium]
MTSSPPLPSPNALRALQLGALALLVAGNLAFSVLAALDSEHVMHWYGSGIPFSLFAAIALAVLFVRVQHAAFALGGPAPVARVLSSIFLCTVVAFIGLPLLIYRTGSAVAVALDDDGIRSRAIAAAWAVGLAPVFIGFGGRLLAVGLELPWMATSTLVSFATVLLSGIATQVVAAPVIEALRGRAPLHGVDASNTSAAIRSL